MQNIQIILSLAGTSIGLLITMLTFLAKFIKNAKLKKAMEQVVTIGNAVIPYINEAEKFSSYSGAEKKAYVMTKANQFAIEKNIPFNENEVSEKIEELVTLTKQVNNKKDSKIESENKTKTQLNNNTSTSQGSWL